MENTKQVQAATLKELDDQGEAINRINYKLHNVKKHVLIQICQRVHVSMLHATESTSWICVSLADCR